MAKYIDPFTDTGFKIVFGLNNVSNEILKYFLNALFEGQPDFEEIVSVRYLNNENVREWIEGKTIVYDVYCETSHGHRFIVEMQKNPQENFLSRAIYYVARSIAYQGYKGRFSDKNDSVAGNENNDNDKKYWNYELIPVVGVFFSNFYIHGLEHKLVTHGRLCDTDNNKPIGNAMRYAFIQLPAFTINDEKECQIGRAHV